jgi:excisionase family DNA binding protein
MTPKPAWAGRAFLSIEETSVLLGVSRSTLYRSIERGDFPMHVVQLNGRFRVPRRGVERLLEGADPLLPAAPTGRSDLPIFGVCPTCGSSMSAPARRVPMCAAARRSSSSTPSV